jgi:hypothetical protein
MLCGRIIFPSGRQTGFYVFAEKQGRTGMHGLITRSSVGFSCRCGNTSVQVNALKARFFKCVYPTSDQAGHFLDYFQKRRICEIFILPVTICCKAALRRLNTRKGATGEAQSSCSPFALKA